MIRCYMGADKVVGFGHQFIKALIPPPPEGPDSEAAQPGPRIMRHASAEPFQALRRKMETEWTPQMMAALGIDTASLPIIWDADFLYGPRTASGEDSYVSAKSTSVLSSQSRTKHRLKLPGSLLRDYEAAPANDSCSLGPQHVRITNWSSEIKRILVAKNTPDCHGS
jgi:hypothetical protein